MEDGVTSLSIEHHLVSLISFPSAETGSTVARPHAGNSAPLFQPLNLISQRTGKSISCFSILIPNATPVWIFEFGSITRTGLFFYLEQTNKTPIFLKLDNLKTACQ